jgi:hypothetical protein
VPVQVPFNNVSIIIFWSILYIILLWYYWMQHELCVYVDKTSNLDCGLQLNSVWLPLIHRAKINNQTKAPASTFFLSCFLLYLPPFSVINYHFHISGLIFQIHPSSNYSFWYPPSPPPLSELYFLWLVQFTSWRRPTSSKRTVFICVYLLRSKLINISKYVDKIFNKIEV